MPHAMKTKLTTRIKYAWYALTGNYWSSNGTSPDGNDFVILYSRRNEVSLEDEDHFIGGIMTMTGYEPRYLFNK